MVLLNIKTFLIFTMKCVELLSKAFGYKKEKVTGTLRKWYDKQDQMYSSLDIIMKKGLKHFMWAEHVARKGTLHICKMLCRNN